MLGWVQGIVEIRFNAKQNLKRIIEVEIEADGRVACSFYKI
jgi:hypothetical protein